MSNEHTDAKAWPDEVETYPATAQDLAAYAHSRHALAQFQAPLLVSQQNPHTRLFVACFDGTGNDKHKDPQHITNIGILYDQVHAANFAGLHNVNGYYVPGVGTQDDALTRNLDGAMGYSYGPRMEEMYLKFINQAKEWQKKDPQAEISIVSTGFSRGAVTAAMFTRMVHERGIQNPTDMKIDRDSHGQILKLTPRHPPLVPPGRTAQTVGLLDPVATGDMNLHDVRLPPSVVSGLQLTARDERRDLFPAKDILHPGHSHDGRFLNLTHPGAHSDIGGYYLLNGLSVRNGNLLIDYVNSLSDKPFLQPRTVPSAPEMNVIHRSEQHGSYYTTTMATTLGHRVHVHNLDGTGMTQAPNDAQTLDAGLRAHLPLRPVAVSPERTDPALPAFFREGPHPHALAAPPLPAYLQQGAMPPKATPHVAAEQAKTVEAPPRPHSPEYLVALARIQRITTAIENGDMETLSKESEAFTNSPRGQAIMAKASAIVQREEQERARQEAQRPPRDPREAGHPDHALNQSIRAQVEKLHTRNGICPTNKTLDYLTASVALNARESGLTRVDQLHFNADKSVIVAERKSDGLDFLPRFSSTNIQQAMQTPRAGVSTDGS
ncbi:XVIPCD domain-containing protein [Xanthomonas albilineans]|uniref:XVIPCD domain-containing protein n=1 Tax=Xanthomonas albilineans TaxID=29447 RepID=UPI0027D96B82|nr:XVIPCD domain-containing protein [Xanthomonas albilineans]